MVDIVQSNKNKLLIRKIGYSVGLESTFKRVGLLVDMYVKEKQLSSPSWKGLVEESYARGKTIKGIEEFFEVLGVLATASNKTIPQITLDVLALLRRYYYNDNGKYDLAFNAIMMYSLTVSDGELLSALLSTEFKASQYVAALEDYRREKLSLFYAEYKAQSVRERLRRIINFEEMSYASGANEKSKSANRRAPPYAERILRAPYAEVNRNTNEEEYFKVSLSDDWYRKVPNHRKNWCTDLDLIDDGKITSLGKRYLQAMRSLLPDEFRNSSFSSGSIIIMPLDIEMISNRVSWLLDNKLQIKLDRLLSTLCDVYFEEGRQRTAIDNDEVIDGLLEFCLEKYSSADVRFSRLRRELPYTVFSLFCYAYCVAEGKSMSSIQDILEYDRRNKEKYNMRSSRNSLWGLSIN